MDLNQIVIVFESAIEFCSYRTQGEGCQSLRVAAHVICSKYADLESTILSKESYQPFSAFRKLSMTSNFGCFTSFRVQ